jgi:hypothetical protein
MPGFGEFADEPPDDNSDSAGAPTGGWPPHTADTPYPRYIDYPTDEHLDDDEFPDYRESGGHDLDPHLGDAENPPGSPWRARPSTSSPHPGAGRPWRGGHRSSDRGRGVSIGVIAALVAVIVVVAGVIVWRFFGDALSNRSHTAAGRCVDSKQTVAVIADPSITELVAEFAERYTTSATPGGDHCVTVNVKSADSDAVVKGLAGNWPADLGGRPALWVPGSSASVARLATAAGQQTISDSRSLVTSPVVLALRPQLQRALGSQTWATLPRLQDKPDGLAGLKLPAWGSLRLALPLSGNGDATVLAAEAVAAASAPKGAPPTAGVGAVRTLVDAQPKLADDSLAEAMNTLLRPGDPATAPVHAVIITEQQLFRRGEALPDAPSELASWLPPGPAAVADYPTVLLSGPWLSQEQVTAASAFARFIHKPDQLAALAKAGFRTPGIGPPSSDVTSFAALPSTLSVGDEAIRAALANAATEPPSTGLAATIMLDQSMSTDEGGKTRLGNVVAALGSRIRALPPNSAVGLWTFDGKEGRAEVPTGPLADPVDGQPRSAALTTTLDKQYSSASGAVSFTTLRQLYKQAQTNFIAGKHNSVLVITARPHTDQTLDGPGLRDFIRQSFDPAKPVAVNVIDFGTDPDRATWEAVAKLSGGSYRNLATSASPELAAAVNALLS